MHWRRRGRLQQAHRLQHACAADCLRACVALAYKCLFSCDLYSWCKKIPSCNCQQAVGSRQPQTPGAGVPVVHMHVRALSCAPAAGSGSRLCMCIHTFALHLARAPNRRRPCCARPPPRLPPAACCGCWHSALWPGYEGHATFGGGRPFLFASSPATTSPCPVRRPHFARG